MFNKSKNNNNNNNENSENEKDNQNNNSLWSWINGKTGSIAIGLAAGYTLWRLGIIQKILKSAGNLFRKKDETSETSTSQQSTSA